MSHTPISFHSETLQHCHLARVTSVDDPDRLARVKVRMLSLDQNGDAEIWARVAAPFAGGGRGALFIPDVNDEVLVSFVAGDPRFPIVLGGLWNGQDTPPEEPGPDRVKRWTITGKNGTRIAIVEEQASQERIELKTPAGQSLILDDSSGGSIKATDASGNSVTMDSQGITLEAVSKVTVNAPQVQVSAGMVSVDAGMSRFSGVVQCDTLITTTVVASVYTPGAGNIW
jgi:uncharacterized protein involved in type VI secretion and phage assembly